MRPLLKRRGRSLGLVQQRQQQHKVQNAGSAMTRRALRRRQLGGGQQGEILPQTRMPGTATPTSGLEVGFPVRRPHCTGNQTLLGCYLPRNSLLPLCYRRLGTVYEGLMSLTWKP